MAPLYHSGGPKCAPCETTKLIYQTSQTSTDGPTPGPDVKVSLPFTEEEEANSKTVEEDQGRRCGEPEEVSEEEEAVSASPLLAGSCVCVLPVCEPLEVGENEDCSQAVSAGTAATCSCGGLDGGKDGDGSGKEEKKKNGNQEKMVVSKGETGAVSPSCPPPELCLPVRGTDTASVITSVSPLIPPSSDGDLYQDKATEASGQDKAQGLLCFYSGGSKLSSGDSELEGLPESLHSQLAEPAVSSGS